MTTPMFSGTSSSMKVEWIECDQTENRGSNMAAHKPEVHLSQIVDEVGTTFQRLFACYCGQAAQRK
jgi:hypothetical protein